MKSRLNDLSNRIKELKENISDMEAEDILPQINGIISDLESELREGIDFRRIVDASSVSFFVADEQGRVLYINPIYTEISGLTEADVVGKTLDELVAADKMQDVAFPDILRERKPIQKLAYLPLKDRKVILMGEPVYDDEGDLRYVVTHDFWSGILDDLQEHLYMEKELREKSEAELSFLRSAMMQGTEIVCADQKMLDVMDTAVKVAPLDVTILITGESGVGKEVISDLIVKNSDRRDKAFVKINCGAIPDNLLESELFGYEKGAFTGAKKEGKPGLFEMANQGTILLDEIGEMPLALQVKLLRVIQNREVRRIGGSKSIKLDVRMIAATNKNLVEEVSKGNFRQDLFYRLNVIPIAIPALRERPKDIEVLTKFFLKKFNQKYRKEVVCSKDVFTLFKEYDWPGNIRELENVMERAVVINRSGFLTAESFRPVFNIPISMAEQFVEENMSLKEACDRFSRDLIEKAIEKHGSLRKAAESLGVSHSTLVARRKTWSE